jgi:hypothetical protein
MDIRTYNMNFSAEYDKLLSSFTKGRNLDLDDATWPEEDYDEFTLEYSKLMARYQAEQTEKDNAKADEEHDESFYLIEAILDTPDGPITEVTDVRKLTLEQLSKLCSVLPMYNKYYFKRVAESL